MQKVFSSLSWRVARRFAGIVFLGAGVFKLFLNALFANYLAAVGVPLPQLFALGVAALEIIGGIAFLFWPREKRRETFARVLAALLAVDMLAAIVLVGLPGIAGKTRAIGGQAIGGEAWRVPLEIALFLVALGCTFSREKNSVNAE